MKFKFTRRVDFENFVEKTKQSLTELFPKIKNVSEKVFNIRLSMENPKTTFREVAEELYEAKKVVDSCSCEIEDYISSLVELEEVLAELNQKADTISEEEKNNE